MTSGNALLWGMALILAFSPRAVADWPQWRGPLGTGAAAEATTSVEFSEPGQFVWQIDLPGPGASTPIVRGDELILTCAVDGQDAVICYGLDGVERWTRQLGAERAAKHRNGSSCAPSPTTDGQRIVAYYKSGRLAALDWQGEVLWQRNLQEDYGKDTLWWDLGTSPVLAGEKVIVAVMQEGESFLLALDATTGEEAWKTARQYECPRESDQAYTTPRIVDIDGRATVVTWGADHLTGHAADSGELLWECGGFNPQNAPMWRVIASAGVADGVAVVPYGRGKFIAGVRLGGNGDTTEQNRLWQREGIGADVPTPAMANGRAYVLGDDGALSCLEAASGDIVWQAKLPRNRNKFYASPLLAGDLLYCVRIDGTAFVGRVSDDGFELLATNEFDETITATPVPVNGGVLIRGFERLSLTKP